MAGQRAPDDPGAASEPPILVQVTVEPRARRATRRYIGLRGLLRPTVALLAAALLAGAILSDLPTRAPKRVEPSRKLPATQASAPGPVGVAAAYRYPRACLSVTIAPADPAYAAVRLNRASPCWRYGAYVTAVFHRVAGAWRMALETSGARCAAASIPAVVRAQLGLCGGGQSDLVAVSRPEQRTGTSTSGSARLARRDG
jgi:hypothetical protein